MSEAAMDARAQELLVAEGGIEPSEEATGTAGPQTLEAALVRIAELETALAAAHANLAAHGRAHAEIANSQRGGA